MPPVMDLTPEQHAEIAKRREAQQKERISASRHLETQEKLRKTPEVFEKNIRDLIEYLEDLGNKREITNFPESFSVPEVEKVAQAVVELSRSHANNKVDTKPILESLKRLESLLDGLPKDHAKQKDSIKVSNLKELVDIIKELDKNVKNIKMVAEAPNVKVNVPAPIVNVEKTDIEPLRQAILELTADIILKEVPHFEPTDTKKIEKELEKANKFLKEFLDKPMGGGGGGGGMVSFKSPGANGASVQVVTEADGSVPVTIKNASLPISVTPLRLTDAYGVQAISNDGTYKYFFFEDDSANWYIMRKTLATKIFKYWKGVGGYASVYVNSTSGPSGTPVWADRGATF